MEKIKTNRNLKQLVSTKSQERADVIIGKKGISQGVIKEIKRRLKEKQIVKVKILRAGIKTTTLNRFELAKKVAEKTGSQLLEVRGRTFILYKQERKTPE